MVCHVDWTANWWFPSARDQILTNTIEKKSTVIQGISLTWSRCLIRIQEMAYRLSSLGYPTSSRNCGWLHFTDTRLNPYCDASTQRITLLFLSIWDKGAYSSPGWDIVLNWYTRGNKKKKFPFKYQTAWSVQLRLPLAILSCNRKFSLTWWNGAITMYKIYPNAASHHHIQIKLTCGLCCFIPHSNLWVHTSG